MWDGLGKNERGSNQADGQADRVEQVTPLGVEEQEGERDLQRVPP